MSSNLYDSLPQSLRKVLDEAGLAESAKQIDAELAKEQAQAYSEKMNAKEAVENFKSEYTKAKQISEYDK